MIVVCGQEAAIGKFHGGGVSQIMAETAGADVLVDFPMLAAVFAEHGADAIGRFAKTVGTDEGA